MATTIAERELLMEGIIESVGSCREGARKLGISPSMLSKIGSGERDVANDLKPQVAKISMKSALAIIIESTGYKKLFSFFTKDRHPQNLIRRAKKEDSEADMAYDKIADRLTDKPNNDDLNDEDMEYIRREAFQIGERVSADMNFLIELDGRYPKLRLKEMFAEKEIPLRER